MIDTSNWRLSKHIYILICTLYINFRERINIIRFKTISTLTGLVMVSQCFCHQNRRKITNSVATFWIVNTYVRFNRTTILIVRLRHLQVYFIKPTIKIINYKFYKNLFN